MYCIARTELYCIVYATSFSFCCLFYAFKFLIALALCSCIYRFFADLTSSLLRVPSITQMSAKMKTKFKPLAPNLHSVPPRDPYCDKSDNYYPDRAYNFMYKLLYYGDTPRGDISW